MAPALQSGLPPAPMPQGALSGSGGMPQPAPQPLGAAPPQQQAPPAPTHQQTVAALRHFDAFIAAFRGLEKNPDLGKSDIKSAFIDAMTGMVAERMSPPAKAVTILCDFPDRPFDQKMYVQQHLQSMMAAKNAVMDHHRAAFAGVPEPMIDQSANSDDHMATMAGLVNGHYRGAHNG